MFVCRGLLRMLLALCVQIYLPGSICLSEYLFVCVCEHAFMCVFVCEATCGVSSLYGVGRVSPYCRAEKT